MALSPTDILELDLLLTARDEATSVVQGLMGTLQSAITQAAGFQTTLLQVQNNTTMTARDAETMRAAVLNLNASSGAPLDQLAQGFMHIMNMGYSAADAVKILTEANMSAISTGSQTADVANTLALQMHEFGASANDAARFMNVLHLAGAEGNATLEQFVTQTSKSVAMAANLGIPIQQVDAALSALSRHMDLSQANTALAGELSKLVNPAQSTIKELEHLSQVTGIDLVKDFTQAGMAARTFPGVMDDLRAATGGNVTEMLRLIPAMRGGLAEMVLLGTGSADYTKILQDLNDTMAGKTDPTTQAYTRTLGTFNQSIQILSANWNQFLMDIGQPIIDTLSPYLHQLIDWMNQHKPEVDAFGKALGTDIANAVRNFVTEVPQIGTAIGQTFNDIKNLTDSVGSFFDTLGTSVHNTIYTIAAGLYTMFATFNVGIDDSLTRVVGGIGDAIANFNAAFHTDIGVPTAPPAQKASDIPRDRQNWLDNIFGVQHPGGGSGGSPNTPAINPLTGKPYQGGGGGFDNPAPGAGGGTSGGGTSGSSGSGAGGFGTGLGADAPGYQSAQQAAAALAEALKQARDQFRYDELIGAPFARLTRDIEGIVTAMKAQGASTLDLNLERAQDLASIAKPATRDATADARRAYQDAMNQFQIDLETHRANLGAPATQALLKGDIAGIVKDMVAGLGYDASDRNRERLSLLAQIVDHTKTATAHLATLASQAGVSRGFLPGASAGFGQSTVSFGAPQQDTSARVIAFLERQLAAANQQIARLEGIMRNTDRTATALERSTGAGGIHGRLVGSAAAMGV